MASKPVLEDGQPPAVFLDRWLPGEVLAERILDAAKSTPTRAGSSRTMSRSPLFRAMFRSWRRSGSMTILYPPSVAAG